MVKKIVERGRELFYCEECLLLYTDEAWAKKCEEWCKKNNSCNIYITTHSLKEVYNG